MKKVTQYLMCWTTGLCLLFFLQYGKVLAQGSINADENKIKQLSIGDYVPDIVFEKVLNYKSTKAKFSDFKGKLVILDMWNTTCTSCIAAFPKMEELQRKFKEQLQILLVNSYLDKYNSEETIRLTLEKNKQRTGFYPSLPVPIHDTLLNSYFPRLSVPHLVWVSAERKVVAITSTIAVTEENIMAYLSGKTLDLAVKNDWGFDKEKPLLLDGNGGGSKDFIIRSVITKYNGSIGYASGVRVNTNREAIGVYSLNKSLRQLVNSAFNDVIGDIKANRIFLNVKNPDQFKQKFDTAYAYCYDLAFPPVKTDSLNMKKYLREDLKRYFNVKVYKEKRQLPCLMISASSKVKPVSVKDDQPVLDFDENSVKKFIHQYSIGEIFHLLDYYGQKPLIDETGLSKQKINIDFPDNVSLFDADVITNALKKAGFIIKEEERELDVVVITDK
jgi:thiol-disulfide isomerase/thioredoxin